MRLLIGVTGSVATIKLPFLITTCREKIPDLEIRVVATAHAMHFIDTLTDDEKAVISGCQFYTDADEWSVRGLMSLVYVAQAWRKRGDSVLHIELSQWADTVLIAPLDANTLAKLSTGLCDNLLTCVMRAWNAKIRTCVVCPAMNTQMYLHPITEVQLAQLKAWGYAVIDPIIKTLICGDTGIGAMATVESIVDALLNIDNK